MGRWISMIAKRTKIDTCCNIDNKKVYGNVVMWSDEGVPMFTPHNKEIIYTDTLCKEMFKKSMEKHVLRKIRFIDNFVSQKDINENKEFYKTYDKSRLQQQCDWSEFLKYNRESFATTLWEIKKYERFEIWTQAIMHASRLYRMAKDLGSFEIAINTKIEAMIIKSRNELRIHRYYDAFKSIKCGLKYKQSHVHLNQFRTIYQNINTEIYGKFNLKYDIKTNMIYFNDDKYIFNERGCSILKVNTNKTTKQKIRNKKQKNKKCALCHLITKGNKKCKGCKLAFYCSRNCQKLHWIDGHKVICH